MLAQPGKWPQTQSPVVSVYHKACRTSSTLREQPMPSTVILYVENDQELWKEGTHEGFMREYKCVRLPPKESVQIEISYAMTV